MFLRVTCMLTWQGESYRLKGGELRQLLRGVATTAEVGKSCLMTAIMCTYAAEYPAALDDVWLHETLESTHHQTQELAGEYCLQTK